jgi:WD40 repeat protein
VAKLNETTIVSGSSDNTLRVWDLNKLPRQYL